MKHTGRKLLSFLLTLAMLVGLMPGMSLAAYAEATSYDVWVGNTQITNENKNDVLGNNTVSFTPADGESPATLTLNNANITTKGEDNSIIRCKITDSLNIILIGENNASNIANQLYATYGIYCKGPITISGSGRLTTHVTGYGISSSNSVTIMSGTINAQCTDTYVNAIHSPTVVIRGGTVTATATGNNSGGINGYNGVDISGGEVNASGPAGGIRGTVRNSGTGTGWTNTEGTEGETAIAVSTTGQTLTTYKKVRFLPPPHTHSFTYSVDGTTITATCSVANCTLTGSKATLTIAAPTMTTYGQTGESISASATLTGLSDFNTATGKSIAATEIKYVGRDGTTYAESATAPTDAGKYTAKITVEGKTASVDYEIAKADPTATAPTATATYGQTLADVTLTNPAGNTAGTWAWSNATTTSVGTVGEQTFNANFTPTDTANYNSKENINVTVTVSKAAAQTIADVTKTLLYTATSISEPVAGKMPDDAGTLTYTAGNASMIGNVTVSNFTVDTDGNVSATLSGGAVGDTVTLPVTISSTNYADSTVNVKITLTAKNDAGVTISGVPAQAKTYGDADFTLTGSVMGAGTGTGVWTWTTSDESVFQITSNGATATVKILKAGSAKITAKYESDTTIGTLTTDSITVNKKAVTVKANDKNIKVGEEMPALTNPELDKDYTVTGLVGSDGLTTPPTLNYQNDGSTATPDKTKAGTYDIVPSGASASDNYTIEYVNGTLTISASGGGGSTVDPAVQNVIGLIVKLPDPITLDDEAKVEAARAAYNALTPEQQDKVTNYNKLTEAEVAIKSAKAQKASTDVIELIQAIPDDPSKSTREQVEAARTAYDALDATAKQLVVKSYVEKLENAEYYWASSDAKAQKAKLKSVKAKKGKKAIAKWKAVSGVSGYQLYYKAKGTKVKKVTINSAKAVKKTVKKLKAGKKYTFKVRTITKVYNPATGKDQNIYGKWSNAKKIKAKK